MVQLAASGLERCAARLDDSRSSIRQPEDLGDQSVNRGIWELEHRRGLMVAIVLDMCGIHPLEASSRAVGQLRRLPPWIGENERPLYAGPGGNYAGAEGREGPQRPEAEPEGLH